MSLRDGSDIIGWYFLSLAVFLSHCSSVPLQTRAPFWLVLKNFSPFLSSTSVRTSFILSLSYPPTRDFTEAFPPPCEREDLVFTSRLAAAFPVRSFRPSSKAASRWPSMFLTVAFSLPENPNSMLYRKHIYLNFFGSSSFPDNGLI